MIVPGLYFRDPSGFVFFKGDTLYRKVKKAYENFEETFKQFFEILDSIKGPELTQNFISNAGKSK